MEGERSYVSLGSLLFMALFGVVLGACVAMPIDAETRRRKRREDMPTIIIWEIV